MEDMESIKVTADTIWLDWVFNMRFAHQTGLLDLCGSPLW